MRTGLLASRRWRMFSTPKRPVDRLARYAARLSSPIHNRPLALDRFLPFHQCLYETKRPDRCESK